MVSEAGIPVGDSEVQEHGAGRPLTGLSVAFVVGVAAGLQWPWQGRAALLAAVPAVVLVGLARGRGRVAWLAGLWIAAMLGGWRGGAVWEAWAQQPLRRWVGRMVQFDGRLVDDPKPRASGGWRADVAVGWLAVAGGEWQPLRGVARISWDGEATVAAGERVRGRATLGGGRAAGNPGQFSERRWLWQGGVAVTGRLTTPPTRVGEARLPWLTATARHLRLRLVDGVNRSLPGPARSFYGPLLGAMVFGDTAAPLDDTVTEAFRRAGVVHVLVASGTQVSLLLGFVFILARALGLPGWLRLVVATPVVVLYSLITGAEPSILRAAVMGWLIFAAAAVGQDHDLPTALAFSAALLVGWQPARLEAVGFQLSFAATVGILVLGLPLAERWSGRWGRLLGPTVAMTIAAQLFTAPLLIYYFRQLSLVGLLANLPVVPLSGILVVSGLAQAVLAQVWLPAAVACGWLNHLLISFFTGLVSWFAAVPGGYRDPFVLTPAGLLGLVVAVGWLTMSVSAAQGRGGRWREAATVWLAVLIAGATGLSAWRAGQARCSVTALDVGQGDSLLIRGPGGDAILIDGGPAFEGRDAGRDAVVPALAMLGVRRLTAVIGTHRHLDHLGGLTAVVQAFPVERVLLPELPANVPAVEQLTAAAADRGVTPSLLRRGDRLALPGGVELYVLWPPARPVRDTGSDVNNNAVVIKVVYGATSWLLCSDLEEVGERFLLRHAGDLRADVLKVPHQGARDACGEELLAAVQPSYAVISCGPNVYGHPAPETLDRLRARHIVVARTDRDGMVTYRSDGRLITEVRHGQR